MFPAPGAESLLVAGPWGEGCARCCGTPSVQGNSFYKKQYFLHSF